MDSTLLTNESMLSLVTDQLNNILNRVVSGNNADVVGVCGLPCVGDCQTCTQSNADLAAFFAPSEPAPLVAPSEPAEDSGPSSPEPEVQVMAYAGDDEDDALEVARARDAVEEAQRSGEAYDEDDYRGCQCLDCLNEGDPNYTRYYDDYDDGGYGLDWNESGYFD